MIRIVVPGSRPRKNARGTIVGRRRITPKATVAWYRRLQKAVLDSISRKPEKLAKSGRWALWVEVYEDEMRHLDVDVPCGDIDSTVSAVLDGLQPKQCGPWAPLDDDARVVEMTVRKHYDKTNPRVEITLTEVT
jgi:Holliday junction resolvase RusA-like endonuclease